MTGTVIQAEVNLLQMAYMYDWFVSWLAYFKNRLGFAQSDSRLSVFVGQSVDRATLQLQVAMVMEL